MSKARNRARSVWWSFPLVLFTFPIWLVTWPFVQTVKAVEKHFLSYLVSRVIHDRDRVYSIKFIWYGDSVYMHPMVWGSFIFYFLAQANVVSTGLLLFYWFIALIVCFVAVLYNFNIIRTTVLAVAVIALLGASYFSTIELAWNPLAEAAIHIASLGASVSPGFFLVAGYVFALLIISEVVWAWFFHRVEIDESYVYEHKFLWGTTREPIFARTLRREIKDLLEVLVLGAADIEHRTRSGSRRFKNVPFASLWLGGAIDSMLDHRRPEQIRLERDNHDDGDAARVDDAYHVDDYDLDEADVEEDVGAF